ncbi:MAG: glycosyltransferase [Anaerolineaceae bacterium]|nr:glycosyltransferase [Anaerolineaceae bacterium]
MVSLSVVVPVYNSQESIGKLADALAEVLPTLADAYELIMVEDDSRDDSWSVVMAITEKYTWATGIKLMRNYGQHNAILCGIRAARYEVIATVDDDLQHPPEELKLLLDKLAEGYDVVYGSPVEQPHGFLRGLASKTTKYFLQQTMGADVAQDASAFRVLRTELRQAFAHYNEPTVIIDVLLTWATKRFASVQVTHRPRPYGTSNYTVGKLINHAFNMMTGFSTVPLRLASILGLIMTVLGLILLFYVVVIRLIFFGWQGESPGFTFLASMIAIFSGAQLFTIGIIGEYLARMHFRLMNKPAYIVRENTSIQREDLPAEAEQNYAH